MRKRQGVKASETVVAVRVPEDLFQAIEEERRRRSRAAGAAVTRSAVIRALLHEAVE